MLSHPDHHEPRPDIGLFPLLAAVLAFLFLLLLLAFLSPGAHAAAHGDESPVDHKCYSIEELKEAYPKSVFTKLSPSETTAWLNHVPDPANAIVVIYSVLFPKDHLFTNVFGYDISGCYQGAVQLHTIEFMQITGGASL